MNASEELFVNLPTGVRLCYQTFGNPSDPAVIFIAGHGSSMLTWPEKLMGIINADGAANNKYFLIRYDHRDSGRSTEFPVPCSYDLWDMAADAEALADHLQLPDAGGYHLVGASMGGIISYFVASRRQELVKSLTLVLTSPGPAAKLPYKNELNEIEFSMAPDRATKISNSKKLRKALHYKPLTDEEQAEEDRLFERSIDREIQSGTLYSKDLNHGTAAWADRPGMEIFEKIKCPTTVIQADKDQMFDVAHGETLAREIEGAEYVLWNDVGHEIPPRIWGSFSEVLHRTWARGEA